MWQPTSVVSLDSRSPSSWGGNIRGAGHFPSIVPPNDVLDSCVSVIPSDSEALWGGGSTADSQLGRIFSRAGHVGGTDASRCSEQFRELA